MVALSGVFLRGARVELRAPSRADAEASKAFTLRLAKGDMPGYGPDRELALFAHDAPTGALLGRLHVEDADWVDRVARLVAWWGPNGYDRAAETLALVASCAAADLDLALEARPLEAGWGGHLAEAGFVREGDAFRSVR